MLGAAARAGTDAPAGLVALLLPARGAGEGSRNGEGTEPRAAEVPRAQGAGFGNGGLWVPGALGKSGRRLEHLLFMAFSCFLGSLDSWMAWAGPGCSAVEPPQHSQPPQHLSFGGAAPCGLPGSCNSAFSSHSLPISSPFSPSLIIHSLICCLSPHAPLAICHCG